MVFIPLDAVADLSDLTPYPPLHFMLKIPPEAGERGSPCPSVLPRTDPAFGGRSETSGSRERIHPEGNKGGEAFKLSIYGILTNLFPYESWGLMKNFCGIHLGASRSRLWREGNDRNFLKMN